MGRNAIIDRRSDRDWVRKRGSGNKWRIGIGSEREDRVTNGGSGSGKGSAIPIHKKRIGAHHCIYDTLILLYLFIGILTTFYYYIITLILYCIDHYVVMFSKVLQY